MVYLYSAESLNSLRPENARAVLAAACLLGGMDDLCGYAYELCRQSISIENIGGWLEFVEAIPPPPPSSSSSSDGSSTPIEPHQMQSRTAVLGPYAQRLRDDVFHFLAARLPSILNVGGLSTPATPQTDAGTGAAPSDAGRDTLLQIYARVPFDLFKAAVESPTFQIGACWGWSCVRGTTLSSLYSIVDCWFIYQVPTKLASSSRRTRSSSGREASRVGKARRRPWCWPLVGATWGAARCTSRASCASGRCGRSTREPRAAVPAAGGCGCVQAPRTLGRRSCSFLALLRACSYYYDHKQRSVGGGCCLLSLLRARTYDHPSDVVIAFCCQSEGSARTS